MSRWKIKKCSFIMGKGRWFTDESQHSLFPDGDKQTDQPYSNEREVHTIVVLIQRHSQARHHVWECCISFSNVYLKMICCYKILANQRPRNSCMWVWARLTHWSRNTRRGDMLCGLLVTHQSIKELPGVALFLDFRYKVCVWMWVTV